MAHSRSHLPICPSIHLSVCPSICTDPVSCLNGTYARLGAVPGLRTCSSLPAGVIVNSPSHRIFFLHLSALPLIGVSVLRVRGLQMHPKCLCLQGAEDLNSGVLVRAQQGSRPCSSLPRLPRGILSGHGRILPLALRFFISHRKHSSLCVGGGACFPQPCVPKAQEGKPYSTLQMTPLGWRALLHSPGVSSH